jgi:hypothetical protein
VTERKFVILALLLASCGSDGAVPSPEPTPDAALPERDAGAAPVDMDASTPPDASDGVDAGPPPFVRPEKLSETGLYADIASGELAAGVQAYRPAHELWSDGASKRRFLSLPAGATIDTSDMDSWVFPVGTKVWKEFSRDGVRVETRLLQKIGADEWFMMPFVWSDDESDALATPDGLADARGTEHDVPRRRDCGECHNSMPDKLLGVSAIQLAHDYEGVNLARLADRLSTAPTESFTLPGDSTQQAALGYMHANCGHCHNDLGSSPAYRDVDLVLWLRTEKLASVADTLSYQTTVGTDISSINSPDDSPPRRIEAGNPDQSAVIFRMMLDANLGSHMPPLASERIDEAGGVAAVRAFIDSLD